MTVTVLAFGMAAPCSSLAKNETTGNSPDELLNVIILYADDMGWGDLGCQGHPYVKTPAIDRLASEGCRLTQFYVTAPICSPSRAGLITGRIQNRYGMQHLIHDSGPQLFHHVPLEEPSLPRLLQSVGYKTAHIGKWHLSFVGREGEPSMQDYGYDFSMVLGASRYGSYRDSKWQRNGKEYKTPSRWTAEVYVDEAIDFMEDAGDRPFFINLWSFAPHQEVDCAAKYRNLYRDRTESEQYFYGAITQMDEQYGRLLDYLNEKGLADKTVVIFASDNGPEPHLIPWSDRARGSTGGLRGGKHHLYDGGIRVPGIVRWPGITRSGSVVREICWTPDILASLCAANGISTSDDYPLDGVDIRGALQGQSLHRIQPLYWQFPFGVGLRDGTQATAPGLALRDGNWKLHCDPEFNNVELYNMDVDENEKWNVHDEYPEVTARLFAKLHDINAEVNGTYSKTARYLNPLMMDSSSTPAKNAN